MTGLLATIFCVSAAADDSSPSGGSSKKVYRSSRHVRTSCKDDHGIDHPLLDDPCLRSHPLEWAERLTALRTTWAVVSTQCQKYGAQPSQYAQFTTTNLTAILNSQAILGNGLGRPKAMKTTADYFKDYSSFCNGDLGNSSPSHALSEGAFDRYHAALTNQEFDGTASHPGINVVGASGYCPAKIADYNAGTAYTQEQLLARLSQDVCGAGGLAAAAKSSAANGKIAASDAATAASADDSGNSGGGRRSSGIRGGFGGGGGSSESAGGGGGAASYGAGALPYRARGSSPANSSGGFTPAGVVPVEQHDLPPPGTSLAAGGDAAAAGSAQPPLDGLGLPPGAPAPDTDLNGIAAEPGFAPPPKKAKPRSVSATAAAPSAPSTLATSSTASPATTPLTSPAKCDSSGAFGERIHDLAQFVITYAFQCYDNTLPTRVLAEHFNENISEYLINYHVSEDAWVKGNYAQKSTDLAKSPGYCANYRNYFKTVTALPTKEAVKSYVCP